MKLGRNQSIPSTRVDAVGMSTVPEAMLCNALSIKTVAVSCIQFSSGIATHKLSHEDVQNASEIALPKMKKLIHLILTELLG